MTARNDPLRADQASPRRSSAAGRGLVAAGLAGPAALLLWLHPGLAWGYLGGAGVGLANWLALRWLVTRRVVPDSTGRAPAALAALIALKTLVVAALLAAVLLAGPAHPLGVFAGVAASLIGLTLAGGPAASAEEPF